MKTLMLLLVMCGSVSGSFVLTPGGLYDSSTGLEWSRAGAGVFVSEVLQWMEPGGSLDGWRYATLDEALALFEHRQEYTTFTDLPGPHHVVDGPFSPDGLGGEDVQVNGFYGGTDILVGYGISTHYYIVNQNGIDTGLELRITFGHVSTFPSSIPPGAKPDITFGHWIVRPVPEPTSLAMWGTLGICFAAWRKWS